MTAKAWADQLPKGYDVLDKETKDGRVANYKELLNLKSETVIVLVKDGVPVDRELVDKKIEELFPNPESEEKKHETTASTPEQSSDYDIVEDDGTEDRDTSDVDVEPFGGYFAGGVERDDYDD